MTNETVNEVQLQREIIKNLHKAYYSDEDREPTYWLNLHHALEHVFNFWGFTGSVCEPSDNEHLIACAVAGKPPNHKTESMWSKIKGGQ
jgi:hypothetical protein